MHLPKFEHFYPASIKEAARLLKKHGSIARLAAGGTDLFPRMKHGLTQPEVVVSLKGLSIDSRIVIKGSKLHLNALMPLADIAHAAEVRRNAPLLAEAILSVGSNQIRQMGTLGGNICLENRCAYYNQSHTFQFVEPCFKRDGSRCYLIPKGKKCVAVFQADTVPALICLDAKVEIIAADSSRQLLLEKLYTGDALKPLSLSQDEIVGAVIIPQPAAVRGTAFSKFSIRGGVEFAAITVAVRLDMASKGGRCAAARITVGSAAAGPLSARKAEKAMAGEPYSDKLFEEIADIVAGEIRPVMHHGYSIPFLKECLKTQTYRTLVLAAERAENNRKSETV
ncbi:MAG: FAD binding domain-containing protein [Desulfobacterales bacterium]|jgi:4-hydroxybenzoyl-CoA reductase beta subunit